MFGDDIHEGISNTENLKLFTSSDSSEEAQIQLISEWIEKNKLTKEEINKIFSIEI
jgi:hypothetical protein